MYTDGASKNNPGIAGIGYVLLQNNIIIKEAAYKLSKETTNNLAEIIAIIVGVQESVSIIGNTPLLIRSDSLLLISQFNGIYKIKHPKIAEAHDIFKKHFRHISIQFEHISRNINQRADMLANKGIHENIPLPIESQNIISSLLFK
jgi:ribonuclease HI